MSTFKNKTLTFLENSKGALSIELMIVAGVVIVLIVVMMSAFSNQAFTTTNQFSAKVSQGLSLREN